MRYGRRPSVLLAALGAMVSLNWAVDRVAADEPDLSQCPYKVVCESHREGNWELYLMKADGSDPVNLTQTPALNEMYPHVSPDGTKVCFVVDVGEGASRQRSVWYMNLDGTSRTKVADNARQPCWSPDGACIAYLPAEFEEFTYSDFATKGIVIYHLDTGESTPHPNDTICHLYNLCWSRDGEWFLATCHGGMGYDHAILAIQADGMGVYNLNIPGCRPDISPDGTKVAWGSGDWTLEIGDLDLSLPEPKVTNRRPVVISQEPTKTYHVDWSPDGKWVAFSRGPEKGKSLGPVREIVGVIADGWDICVADAEATNSWVRITTDGKSNKEPDWAPLAGGAP